MLDVDIFRIQQLPDELINYIKDFLTLIVLIFVEKKTYILYHDALFYKILNQNQGENYIRFIIRNDLDFVLSQIFENNYKQWINKTKYLYEDTIYCNYLSFILHFILKNNSDKCKQLTNKFCKKLGISKKLYKNNTFINKRWKL